MGGGRAGRAPRLVGAERALLKALCQLTAARDLKCTTSLDTNNDASGRWGAEEQLASSVLPLVDVFLPSEIEARGVGGAEQLPAALEALASRVRHAVVVSVGADGAIARARDATASRGVTRPRVPERALETKIQDPLILTRRHATLARYFRSSENSMSSSSCLMISVPGGGDFVL